MLEHGAFYREFIRVALLYGKTLKSKYYHLSKHDAKILPTYSWTWIIRKKEICKTNLAHQFLYKCSVSVMSAYFKHYYGYIYIFVTIANSVGTR